MTPLVLRASRLKYIGLLGIALTLVAGGVYAGLQAKATDALVAWGIVAFFGVCAAAFAWQLFDRRPRVVIDDSGVFDRSLRVGTIPWSQIEDAYPKSIATAHFVCLVLRDADAWLARLPAWQRSLAERNVPLGFEPFSVNLSGLPSRPDAVLARIRDGIAAHR